MSLIVLILNQAEAELLNFNLQPEDNIALSS